MNFKDKTALITGAGSGIGKATALLFAQEGANLALLGKTRAKQQEIESNGAQCLVLTADVSDDAMMRQAFAELGCWDHLDVLFANAGSNGRAVYRASRSHFRICLPNDPVEIPWTISDNIEIKERDPCHRS